MPDGRRSTTSGRRAAVTGVVCGLLLAACGAGAGVQTPAGELGVPAGADAGGPSPSASPGAGAAPTDSPTDSPADAPAPTIPSAADLRGLWGAGEEGGAEIVYEFDPDGTFTRISLLQQKRQAGTFKFQDIVEGTFRLEGATLTLRPTAGTQTVDDPRTGDGPVSTRTKDLTRETHAVELRQDGSVLVMTPADGAALTLVRQQG